MSERDYFLRRAEAELAMAQQATAERAVKAHYTMAEAYLELAYGEPSADNEKGETQFPCTAQPGAQHGEDPL